jgi:hypothetical protein
MLIYINIKQYKPSHVFPPHYSNITVRKRSEEQQMFWTEKLLFQNLTVRHKQKCVCTLYNNVNLKRIKTNTYMMS